MLLSKWSQDRTVFRNVFWCVWCGLAEVAGVISWVESVYVVSELWVVSRVEACKVNMIGSGK